MENLPQWLNWTIVAIGGTSIGASIYVALAARFPRLAFWLPKVVKAERAAVKLKHDHDEKVQATEVGEEKTSFDDLMDNVKADPFGTLDEIERRRMEASKLVGAMRKVHGELYSRMQTVAPELFEQAPPTPTQTNPQPPPTQEQ